MYKGCQIFFKNEKFIGMGTCFLEQKFKSTKFYSMFLNILIKLLFV